MSNSSGEKPGPPVRRKGKELPVPLRLDAGSLNPPLRRPGPDPPQEILGRKQSPVWGAARAWEGPGVSGPRAGRASWNKKEVLALRISRVLAQGRMGLTPLCPAPAGWVLLTHLGVGHTFPRGQCMRRQWGHRVMTQASLSLCITVCMGVSGPQMQRSASASQ